MPRIETGEELEKNWSDRCISCKSLDCEIYICKRINSPMFNKVIENVDTTTCRCWRYKF